jgi:hypothetical protein
VYSDRDVTPPYDIAGFPHAHLVCEKRNQSCSCEKGLNINAVQRIENRTPSSPPEPVEINNNGHEEVASAEKVALPTSAELEEVTRQARKDKRYAIEQHEKVDEPLVTMLVQALKDDDPGAFFAVSRGHIFANDVDLDIDKLYKYMARSAARLFMPPDYDSMTDLVQKTNRNLARLGLPAISLEKTLAETFDVESSPEIASFPTL